MENIVNKVKPNRSLVLWIFAALLVGLVLGTGLGGGSVGGLKSSYLGDDSITCTRTCPDGSTIDANNSCPDNQSCTNGASNYPDCNDNAGYCGDGTCNNGEDQMSCSSDCGSSNTCTNGASNYPDCNDNAGYCGDGTCNNGEDQMSCSSDCGSSNTCTNGASNYPDCNDNIIFCTNGATNPPECDQMPIRGCTDKDAYNYNPNAQENDGSCEYCATEHGDIERINQDLAHYRTLRTLHPGQFDQHIADLEHELAVAEQDLASCINTARGD